MSTGSNSKGHHGIGAMNRAVDLRFKPDRVVVVLADGREISVPLDFYPTLQQATERQRNVWEMIGNGQGFHWPTLDLDLSVEGLIEGLREAIPPPPRRPARKKPRAQATGSR